MAKNAVAAPPSALELGQLYLSFHGRLRRMIDADCGVSLSRTKVLGLLTRRGPVNQAAIAAELGFAPRSITDLVDGLTRDGFAERLDDPADRRSRLIRITDSGTVAYESAVKVKNDVFEDVFSVLDPQARTELFALMQSLYNALPSQPGDTNVC